MIAQLLSFVKKSPNDFSGNWGGQAVGDFDPNKNRIELLRFTGILLSDANKSRVSSTEILDCICGELNATVAVAEQAELLACLQNHPSFKKIADDLFELA